LRDKGKRAELACGYGGWVGAWIAFGADKYMTEEEMKKATLEWRAASPEIPEFWGGQWRRLDGGGWRKELFGVEGAFVGAILSPGTETEYRGFKFRMEGDALYLRLLSGRYLTYHRPRLQVENKFGRDQFAISYEGWNTNPKNGPIGWIRIDTYGGRLTENIVQATARDIQWYGMRNLTAAGYPIVLHVYDEDVAEVPEGFGSIEEFEAIMSTMPPWAADWPIRANGGWRGKRYRKD
jgi:DNA polymerase